MKVINFKIVLMFIVFTAVFSSCKKDEATKKSEYTYDGKTYSISKGFHENHGGPYQTIFLANDAVTFDQATYSYSATSDGIEINLHTAMGSEISGTYPASTEYEVPNTLNSISIVKDGVSIYQTEAEANIGSVVVSGDEVSFTVKVAGKDLTVFFKGALTYANLFLPGKK